MQSDPNSLPVFTNLYYYCGYRMATLTNTKNLLVIQIPILLRHRHHRPMNLYNCVLFLYLLTGTNKMEMNIKTLLKFTH